MKSLHCPICESEHGLGKPHIWKGPAPTAAPVPLKAAPAARQPAEKAKEAIKTPEPAAPKKRAPGRPKVFTPDELKAREVARVTAWRDKKRQAKPA